MSGIDASGEFRNGKFVSKQSEQAPFIEFILDSEEDREATLKSGGKLMMRDVHIVQLRQRGATDFATVKVSDWLAQAHRDSNAGRQPEHWASEWEKAYEKWKADMDGENITGHDLRKWPGVSKAQLHNLRQTGIITVEDVSRMTDAVVDRMGMGARALRSRAQAWLEQANGESRAEEVAQARDTIKAQASQIEDLQKQVTEINARLASGNSGK